MMEITLIRENGEGRPVTEVIHDVVEIISVKQAP